MYAHTYLTKTDYAVLRNIHTTPYHNGAFRLESGEAVVIPAVQAQRAANGHPGWLALSNLKDTDLAKLKKLMSAGTVFPFDKHLDEPTEDYVPVPDEPIVEPDDEDDDLDEDEETAMHVSEGEPAETGEPEATVEEAAAAAAEATTEATESETDESSEKSNDGEESTEETTTEESTDTTDESEETTTEDSTDAPGDDAAPKKKKQRVN